MKFYLCLIILIFLHCAACAPAYISDNFETEYLCTQDDCPQGFSTERECFYHCITAHISRETIACPLQNCGHCFKSKRSLGAHLNREHRIFNCNFCKDDIKYNNFDELKIHLREKHMSK